MSKNLLKVFNFSINRHLIRDSFEVTSSATILPFESIPRPKALPLLGTLLELVASGGSQYMHLYCDRRHQQLGGIYCETLGNVEAVFISDALLMQKVYQFEGKYPQHMVPEPWILYNQINGIKRGLFFMDGKEWSARRKSLNKVFLTKQSISQYCALFNEVSFDFTNNWEQRFSRDSQLIVTELEKELYQWSIESLGTMIFGRRLSRHNSLSRDSHTLHEFVACVQQIFTESANMQLIPPKVAFHLNLNCWQRFESAATRALSIAREYVRENVREIQSDRNATNNGLGIIRELLRDSSLDEEEIVRIVVDLFIAAADTTSHATQWALYMLARNRETQEKMYREVKRVSRDSDLREEDLNDLSFVKAVIKESLRLYPVAPFLSRYLTQDLDLKGYQIPNGKLVVMSLFTSGRSEKYFSNARDFIPERWLRDKSVESHALRNSYAIACLPFGLGIRSCIGRRVAEIQMQFLLSRIIQKFSLESTQEREIGIKLRMITTPEKRIDLKLRKRQ